MTLQFGCGGGRHHLYPDAAKLVKNRKGKSSSPQTVSRRMEHLSNLCWDTPAAKDLVLEYLGIPRFRMKAACGPLYAPVR